MIDPNYVFVVESGTTVFEDGFGQTDVDNAIAVLDYYDDHVMPKQNRPAYKAHGSHGDVFIPKSAVTAIQRVVGDYEQ